MKHVNYNNCIVGIPNSVLSYFGLKCINQSNEIIDEYLKKYSPKNVVVLLCDGMGHNFFNEKLSENSFLRKNEETDISSVFPPTTTAATTSIITGLYPNEHCWLGWDNYVAELDKVVTMFLNREKDTDIPFDVPNICGKIFPYKTIFEMINESGVARATYISPYAAEADMKYETFEEMCELIKHLCDSGESNYIYAYYENPDSLMHKYGINSEEVVENIQVINKKLEELSLSLSDTLLIITADHGLTKNKYIYIEDDKDLFDCLSHTTSIDSRASMFFIRGGYEERFIDIFNRKYKNDFLLLSKNEIIEKQLFGIGINNDKFESCLGDYIAISISDKSFKYIRHGREMLANHAGLTENEVDVPLILKYIKR